LVVWVPRDVKPGVILFTNETAPVPLYDRKYFLLVVPADARPSQRADAEAFLKTPDGTHPVVFRKPDAGVIDILAHSIEDALAILKQIGLQPEYRGKAELRIRGAEGAESLSVAKGLVYHVPGVVVWKGRRIAVTDLLLSTYGVVASRRVEGDAELPCEPEYILLDKYIYNKEEAHIRAR
jgi:hypothetical protein